MIQKIFKTAVGSILGLLKGVGCVLGFILLFILHLPLPVIGLVEILVECGLSVVENLSKFGGYDPKWEFFSSEEPDLVLSHYIMDKSFLPNEEGVIAGLAAADLFIIMIVSTILM